MIRVLFVARYRDDTMRRKVHLLALNSDLSLLHLYPSRWEDELHRVDQRGDGQARFRQMAVPMIGRPADPHRALYRTIAFGMRTFRPDIIHAEEEPDSLAALQLALARRAFAPRSKLVLYTWQNINRPKKWYVKLVLRSTLGAADCILCASREAVRVLGEEGYRGATAVLPAVGVDTETFTPRVQRQSGGEALNVGYVGRLVEEKGLDTLIEAAAVINKSTGLYLGGEPPKPLVKLLILGDGPARARLAGMAQERGEGANVCFVPPVPADQVAQRMKELDVLVLPSRTTGVWKEQFGRVLAEAMACKVPVVGSSSGAIPEVIGDAGLVYPEGDHAALADCLRRLAASATLRANLGERGYTRAISLYSQERIAEQTASFYRQLERGELR